MKKIFTLALLAVITLTSYAGTRKWDFTKWSATTIENLKAGAGQASPASNWSDIEKASGTAPTDVSKENCYWEVSAQGNATTGATVQANGQDIAELSGLLYTNTASRSLAIAINYQSPNAASSFGPYNGASYLWLGSSKKNYFVIPNVKAGATIKIGIESHKTTDARGVNLYIVAKGAYNTLGTQLKDADGNVPSAPTTYQDQTWVVPADGLTDTANEDGTYDVMIYNTNGCHLYYITVDEGGSAEENKNIAWVSGDINSDMNKIFAPTTGVDYTDIAAESDITADSLRTFDAVVISTSVAADSKMGKLLAENIAYVPMVNLNTNLFGYTAKETANTTLTAVNSSDELFEGIDMNEGSFDYTNIAVALPEKFASDNVLAKNGEDVAIHEHASKRNAYILIPTDESGNAAQLGSWQTLIGNAINAVAATKKSITATTTPSISLAYADGKTTATITCSTTGSKIQYAIGNGDFQDYTAPIEFTAADSISAKATAEGYTDSEVAGKAIDIQTQAATPTIEVSEGEGQTTITLASSDNSTIYYSFSGQTTKDHAATYTEPIVVKEPGTITVLAAADGKLASEVASQDFGVAGIPAVKDTISHFTANEADWFTNASVTANGTTSTLADAITAGTASGAAKAVYYFGKSAWKYYSEEVDHVETVFDADGVTPLKCADGVTDSTKTVYKKDETAYKYVSSSTNTDWIIESEGQAITGETNQGPVAGVSNGTAGRYADEAIDEIGAKPSTGFIDFGGKTSGEPYTMRFKSTKTFDGEFDVVTYLGNGGTSDIYIGLQKSADGTEWTTVDTLNYSKNQRFYKKTRIHMNETTPVYLRVAQLGGGSKGYIYDIYVIRTEGTTTSGIENVASTTDVKATAVRKIVRNGQVLIKTANGIFNTVGARVE